MPIRSFRVNARDVPVTVAARRMELTEKEFIAKLPELLNRGFPAPDPTTAHFDLEAIDAWCAARNPHISMEQLTSALDATGDLVQRRLRAMERG